MDKWAEMSAFVAVVERNGFAAAARALNVSPSGLSRQVSSLEERLGVRLLTRTTRRLSLTEAGERFFARSRAILGDIGEIESEVADLQARPRGRLRVSCVVTLAQRQMAPILAGFMAAYPEITVELWETERPLELLPDRVEVALVSGPVEDSSLRQRRLADFRRLVCAAPAYLAHQGTPATPADLRDHACLGFTTAPHLQHWEFRSPDGRPVTRAVRPRFLTGSAEILLQAALAGIGIGRLASFMVAPHLRDGSLVEVLAAQASRDRVPLSAIFAPGEPLAPKVRVFIDHLVSHFSPGPPWEREG